MIAKSAAVTSATGLSSARNDKLIGWETAAPTCGGPLPFSSPILVVVRWTLKKMVYICSLNKGRIP